ncbi:MAG: ABC transporter ATP-binding protein [Acidobacteria bacterium]|nr:MAG: ABC transporter ATP-binding protein [Acidobacteriota bacterium]
MGDKILSVRGLGIKFGSRSVIRNLSFDVCAGDNLAIIGPNGAGKTVLLKALLNFLSYEGEIRWAPNARIGYVPQKIAADRQMPVCVGDLLAAKAHVLKLSSARIGAVTSLVDLNPEILNTSIGTISGGQFQKALIAFALLGEPNVLLFDEPTASLDELAEERIYDLLERLQREQQLTILLVSHDLSIVYRAATKVLCVSKDLVCFGPPREVLTPSALEAMYSAPAKYYQHRRDIYDVSSNRKQHD